jgi:hypothetical protein
MTFPQMHIRLRRITTPQKLYAFARALMEHDDENYRELADEAYVKLTEMGYDRAGYYIAALAAPRRRAPRRAAPRRRAPVAAPSENRYRLKNLMWHWRGVR